MADNKAHPHNPDPADRDLCMCGQPEPAQVHDAYRNREPVR